MLRLVQIFVKTLTSKTIDSLRGWIVSVGPGWGDICPSGELKDELTLSDITSEGS
jgi:hypothetical protein